MENLGFHDGNLYNLIDKRCIDVRQDGSRDIQMHSSLIRRLSLESELEGHQGCVNAISWNTKGTLLISGSDDTRINIWSYTSRDLVQTIETGHTANIFCTKFLPETSDELVVSGAADAEVRLFNLSSLNGQGVEEVAAAPTALFQCHTRRVKKLAVEVGNPNVVWSASEDGTLRQHDLREGTSCPQAGSSHQECRNVLLDLRCGAKRSLADPPKQCLALKSCDISSTRPHLLLVGGSDAFARLYDRRMLPPLSSCQKKIAPPRCVNYFSPMHLSDYARPSLHLTHVAFSPNSEEVLLNYSGEHIYLMDVARAGQISGQYTSEDVMKLTKFTPMLHETPQPLAAVPSNSFSAKKHTASTLDKCKKLLQFAERSVDERDYFYGIEAYNEVLEAHDADIGPELEYDCLCTRAALFLKRKWKNDVHMAVRDCIRARTLNSSSYKAFLIMSEALLQLRKYKEALDYAGVAQSLDPRNDEIAEMIDTISRHMADEAEMKKGSKGGASKSDSRFKCVSVTDIPYRPGATSDTSQEGPRSERDDSDYDDVVELDFETALRGDEGHDSGSNNTQGSLNLRVHLRNDTVRENGGRNGSSSPFKTPQNSDLSYQPEAAIDMKRRFVGHCNMGTDIKQASFLGQKGDYIAGGSDDGRWFIWEKKTGRLIKMLLGDDAVVNCIQSHPSDCAIATSGIDNTIKIWTPTSPVPSIVAGGAAGPDTADVVEAIKSNQQRLNNNCETILPFELFERFRMHEFNDGALHPFECAQS
uniref:WD and tetratricopeptide repeats protein 1 n=1 Tax=Kalanchoe fedtschenkoi TaxID=63787 RepID=A0A7N0UM05_KALFE